MAAGKAKTGGRIGHHAPPLVIDEPCILMSPESNLFFFTLRRVDESETTLEELSL